MGKIRELLSDTLIYGISSVVARFVNYLMVPLYTKFFDPAAYGIIGLIYGAIVFLNVLFTFGMESSYLRYGANRKKAATVFASVQYTLVTGATLLAFISWVFMPFFLPLIGLEGFALASETQVGSFIHPLSGEMLFLMMLSVLWLDALCMVPFAELRLVRRAFTYALVRLMNVLINVSLNLYLVVWAGWGIEAVLFSNMVASGCTVILLFVLTAPLYRSKVDRRIIRRVLWFGLPYIPAGLSHAINEVLGRFAVNNMSQETVDRLYGSQYTAEDITGIFNACIKLSVFMLLVVQMFRMAWLPFFMRQSTSKDARQTFARVFTLFNLAAAAVFIAIGLFTEELVRLPIPLLDGTLIDSRYWMGLHIVPWLLMAYWFQGWFINFLAGVFIEEKMWYLAAITMIGALITLIGNTLLVPLFGMSGAVWVSMACFFSMAMLMYLLTRKVYQVPYKLGLSALIVCFSALVVMLGNGFGTDFFEPAVAKVVLFVLSLLTLAAAGVIDRSVEY